jgi:hypothetical protein
MRPMKLLSGLPSARSVCAPWKPEVFLEQNGVFLLSDHVRPKLGALNINNAILTDDDRLERMWAETKRL